MFKCDQIVIGKNITLSKYFFYISFASNIYLKFWQNVGR